MSSPDTTTPGAGAAQDAAAARLVRRVLRSWPLVVGLALVFGILGFVASSARTSQYQATTTIQLGQADLSALFVGTALPSSSDDVARAAVTNSQLITLPGVRKLASQALGGTPTAGQLEKVVTVANASDSNLISITAQDPSPTKAAAIANAMTSAFIQSRQAASRGRIDQAKAQVRAQISSLDTSKGGQETAALLRERLRQVDVLGAVGDSVDVAQAADVPTQRVSPSPKRDAIVALLFGGLIGITIAFLRARLDDRIRDAAELGELWDLPLVGSVPRSKDLIDERRDLPSGEVLEAFSLARTNLRYLHVGGDVKSVVITSSISAEGKSTISWNLALASALAESRVLLIEADLRRPALTARLGLHAKNGLAEVLAGIAEIDDAIVPVTFGDESRGLGGTVDVMPAGLVPPSPIALLERDRFPQLLESVADRYDLILIDSPPTTVVADSLIISRHVDGVLVVSRLGRARRGQFLRLSQLLAETGTPVLGQLINGVSQNDNAYGYSSYYNKTDSPV